MVILSILNYNDHLQRITTYLYGLQSHHERLRLRGRPPVDVELPDLADVGVETGDDDKGDEGGDVVHQEHHHNAQDGAQQGDPLIVVSA